MAPALTWLEYAFSQYVVDPLATLIFFDVVFWDDRFDVPLVVLWLV